MNKKLLSIILAVVLVALGAILIVAYSNGTLANIFSGIFSPKIDAKEIVLFYGDGCPHCKLVEDFVTQNKIEEKVKFTRLEVPFGEKTSSQLVDNAKILLQKMQACNLKVEQVGIPFLWDGKTCIIGDQDIIKFFQEKTK